MPAKESICSSAWSREEDKQFERAIANFPEDSPERWEKIAAEVPGKSTEEIRLHYELLIEDVERIESGYIQVPCYNNDFSSSSDGSDSHGGCNKKSGRSNGDSNRGKPSKLDQERRKGIAWTEDEHRLFLLGLEKYGKGDWRSISRNFVVTRTPTQVASHAQKYFIRLNSINKERRRSSIHDITSIDGAHGGGDPPGPQAPPITGSTTVTGHKQGPAHVGGPVGLGMYGPPPVGQPVNGPIAVGTPVRHFGFGLGGPAKR